MNFTELPHFHKPFRLTLGERGEMIGWGYLVRQGYKILEKNFRCPLGEIDVIAMKNHRIVFIEIKTRTSDRFGRPEEAVNHRKQKKMGDLAEWYMKSRRLSTPVSFHVLAITLQGQKEPEIKLIENAFDFAPAL